jgi:flagellar hook-associated protein 3 FlgL
MRISTPLSQQLAINAMLAQQAKLSKTQLQLSTGERVLTPSDDPAGAVRALDLTETLESIRQYQSTLQTGRNRLEFEDSVLEGAGNVLQRARELTVQGLNGTLTAQDRQAIGQEVAQLRDQLLGLSNTKNANGEYIFSGYRSATPAYRYDDALIPPGFTYQGDANQRQLQVGALYSISDGDPGFAVFEDIPSVGLAATASGTGKRSVLDTLNTLADALAGTFTVPRGTIRGTADLSAGVDYSGGPVSFDLAVDGGPTTTVTIAPGTYEDAKALAAAINAGIAASSLDGTVTAQARSGHIEFVSANSGSASMVSVSNDADGFLSTAGFSDLQTGSGADLGADPFGDTAGACLTDIDAALQRIGNIRASVGARLNALDTQESMNSKFMTDAQANLSETKDLDYAEAIGRFNLQQVALQAAQQAYAKVQGMSLFNYLR